MSLIDFTSNGLYCAQADVYIDPWKPVKNALITHGHADHARAGSRKYMATLSASPVLKLRLGSHIDLQSVAYGEVVTINGVSISFHPAGHIIGSAQIRLEYKGEIWVVSGDYKTEYDGISEAFELVKCHAFISECTFGLPVFKWSKQSEVFDDINEWWRANQADGKASIISAYSLGKAQRLLNGINPEIGKIFAHAAIENVNDVIRKQRIKLPETTRLDIKSKAKEFAGSLVIVPPSAMSGDWTKRLGSHSLADASGWMGMRGTRRRKSVDRGFVLSDHADWEGLLDTIKETGAEKIFVTHGYTDIFCKYLQSIGYDAHIVSTEYNGDDGEGE